MAEFAYEDLLPIGPDQTDYRLITTEGVSTVEGPGGRTFLEVSPDALRALTAEAMHDIAHYLRPAHLAHQPVKLPGDDADQFRTANASAGIRPARHAGRGFVIRADHRDQLAVVLRAGDG